MAELYSYAECAGEKAASGFRLVNLLADGTGRIFFMVEKTFFLIGTIVSGTDMIICLTETIVSVARTMAFTTRRTFSAAATMIFIGEMIISAVVTIAFGAEMIISGIETMVGGDIHPIDFRKVSATIDFDHGLRHREDLFSRGNDHFNDRQDLLGS